MILKYGRLNLSTLQYKEAIKMQYNNANNKNNIVKSAGSEKTELSWVFGVADESLQVFKGSVGC